MRDEGKEIRDASEMRDAGCEIKKLVARCGMRNVRIGLRVSGYGIWVASRGFRDAGERKIGKDRLRMSYKKLEIWQLARESTIAIHRMTLDALPKFEMYEEGSQIRRSSKDPRGKPRGI